MSDNFFPVCAVFTHNASATLTDWISWHLAIGFKKILIIDNHSDDATEELIATLTEKHPIEWHQPLLEGEQTAAEKRLALTHYCLKKFKEIEDSEPAHFYFCILDADEFLETHPNLETVYKRYQHQQALFLNWCFYGTLNHSTHKSKKHLIARHEWRADKLFKDHQFGKLLFRFSALPDIESITDPFLLNIPENRIIASNGTEFNKKSPPIWEGGRILHYVHSQEHSSSPTSFLVKRYYNRCDIKDLTPQQGLYQTRLIKNILWRDYLDYGIKKLKLWAENFVEEDHPIIPDRDFKLPERAERIGFEYQRIRSSRKNRYLLSEQAYPPYGRSEIFLLQHTINNQFLLADELFSQKDAQKSLQKDEKTSSPPLLALINEHHPELISLFLSSRKAFILGDIPAPHGVAIFKAQRSKQHNLFTLPEEAGYEGAFFRSVIFKNSPSFPDILPAPIPDMEDGLSLDALLLWLEHHPLATKEDICRALRLLNPSSSKLVEEVIPHLSAFLA